MKFGIYYAFWEKEWGVDYIPYIKKVSNLGFDILEISAAGLDEKSDSYMKELRKAAEDNNIILTGGYGPRAIDSIVTSDKIKKQKALDFYKTIFEKLALADIHILGGGLYSYWPVDYSLPIDKQKDRELSIQGVMEMADIAKDYNIDLGMEVLNRFEGYILNTAEEGIEFVKEVDRSNVYVMLDTFHMNIEEDSICDAIKSAGKLLGHFHIGEANRRLPHKGGLDWFKIGQALKDINYDRYVVMEPFILQGGQVGKDIKVFRDLSNGASSAEIDKQTEESLNFVKSMFL